MFCQQRRASPSLSGHQEPGQPGAQHRPSGGGADRPLRQSPQGAEHRRHHALREPEETD